jgi:glycosyltransferase involved in cell wall biosynthesis
MVNGKKIIVVLPAYNAAKTLKMTLDAIPKGIVDDVLLVDDASRDNTVEVAKGLGLKVFTHYKNLGYGGNQKTCYKEALKLGADIVVMVHPDFQYDPVFIPEVVRPIAEGQYDAMIGSRMKVRKNALKGGMPYWKFISNIFLTKLENFILGYDLSEYHSGFRAYSKKVIQLPIDLNSNDFVFDTEIIVQIKIANLKIGEVPISTKYFQDASKISFKRSVEYGMAILRVMSKYLLFSYGLISYKQFALVRQ